MGVPARCLLYRLCGSAADALQSRVRGRTEVGLRASLLYRDDFAAGCGDRHLSTARRAGGGCHRVAKRFRLFARATRSRRLAGTLGSVDDIALPLARFCACPDSDGRQTLGAGGLPGPYGGAALARIDDSDAIRAVHARDQPLSAAPPAGGDGRTQPAQFSTVSACLRGPRSISRPNSSRGSSDSALTANTAPSGKLISAGLPPSRRRMCAAAQSALTRKGMRNLFPAVIGVAM